MCVVGSVSKVTGAGELLFFCIMMVGIVLEIVSPLHKTKIENLPLPHMIQYDKKSIINCLSIHHS